MHRDFSGSATLDNNWNRDKQSVPFSTHLMNGRNELLPDPFDEFDPHHSISGKKAFNPNVVKCLQSRINLKNDAAEMLVRPKLPNVNASVIAVHNQ